MFVAMAVAYAIKIVTTPKAVQAEFAHPIAGNLFGTAIISVLLLPIVVAPIDLSIARTLRVIGALSIVGFAWRIVDRWLSDRQQVVHATPARIVPVVGMLDIALAVP